MAGQPQSINPIRNQTYLTGRPALAMGEERISWMELDRLVGCYGRILRDLPLRSRYTAIHLGKHPRDIALFLACVSLKLPVLLVPDYYATAKAIELCEQFAAGNLLALVDGELRVTAVMGATAFCPTPRPPHICLLTSGTTGKPKCVVHLWESLANAVKVEERFKGRTWFLAYPITHFAGMQVFLQSYLNGGCSVLPQEFTAAHAREAIDRHEVQYLNCTPTFVRQLLLHGGGEFGQSLRHVTLGGEVVDQHILDAVRAKWPWVKTTHIYASSELGAMVVIKDGKAGFDSGLLDGRRLKVVDGELYGRVSESAMRGYFGTDALSEEWLPTRDLVEVRGDRVHFLGRKDDVINVGGFKVSPALVEQTIRRLPCIAEVAITAQKHSLMGNLIKAVVCLREGADRPTARAEILAACRAELPYYSQPRLFEFTDAPRLNANQKLVRL